MNKSYFLIAIFALGIGFSLPNNAYSRFVSECENQLCFFGVKECIDAKEEEKLQCDGPDDDCTGESSCTDPSTSG